MQKHVDSRNSDSTAPREVRSLERVEQSPETVKLVRNIKEKARLARAMGLGYLK